MISRNPQDNLPLRVAFISLSMEKDNHIPETLYKYRKLSTAEDVRRFFDIIVNKRLYAAPLEQLNDPFEGVFYPDSIGKDQIDELKIKVKNTRICSLTTVKDNKVMWNAYADSFSGCCIELKVTSQGKWDPLEVTYEGKPPKAARVKDILKVKSQGWGYEKEVRYIRPLDTVVYLRVKVIKIYFGYAMAEKTRKEYTRIIHKINNEIKCVLLSKNELKFCSPSDMA